MKDTIHQNEKSIEINPKTPPEFIIIGAAKSGTTAFFDALCHHPDVYGSPVKEPHFFSQFQIENFSENFRLNNVFDAEEYFSQTELTQQFQLFVSDLDQYTRLFEPATAHSIRGEASTSYLFSSEAPRRILEHNPQTKIIAILRNPVERAFSHYIMALKYGYTTDDFISAIRKDQEIADKGWGKSQLYLELGHYDEQVERYYHYFPREQIHLIQHEIWKSEPDMVFREVLQFLNLDPKNEIPQLIQNAGEVPRYPRLNRMMHQWGLRQRLANRLTSGIKNTLRRWYLQPKNRIPFDPETRHYLMDYYRPRIERLENIWDRDLSMWKE